MALKCPISKSFKCQLLARVKIDQSFFKKKIKVSVNFLGKENKLVFKRIFKSFLIFP